MLHETPLQVARELARHVPLGGDLFLEPAVGEGALVAAVARRYRKASCRFVCIDIDSSRLSEVPLRVGANSGTQISLLHGDFLSPKFRANVRATFGLFDCVVMNPPFLGKKKNWKQVRIGNVGGGKGRSRLIAPEAAFLLHAIEMLRPAGRVVAILPSSIVAGAWLTWYRQHLLTFGNFRRVHELQPGTFSGVDAATYLVVFEKAAESGSCTLCNHRLIRPDKMTIQDVSHSVSYRLDYAFYRAKRAYDVLLKRDAHLGWRTLAEIAGLERGRSSSSTKCDGEVHSSSYIQGFWELPRARTASQGASGARCRNGDLMIARVGRNCSSTIGRIVGHGTRAFTDCVFRIRPHVDGTASRLLFALRCFFACGLGQGLLERGGGASYLTKADLLRLPVPTLLWKRRPSDYRQYRSALKRRSFQGMLDVEKRVREAVFEIDLNEA